MIFKLFCWCVYWVELYTCECECECFRGFNLLWKWKWKWKVLLWRFLIFSVFGMIWVDHITREGVISEASGCQCHVEREREKGRDWIGRGKGMRDAVWKKKGNGNNQLWSTFPNFFHFLFLPFPLSPPSPTSPLITPLLLFCYFWARVIVFVCLYVYCYDCDYDYKDRDRWKLG